jgi:hypothetical protein
VSNHTPGPWAVGKHRGVWVGPVISAEDGRKGVAFVCGESNANARLIAAAPELLAALHVAADALDYAQAQVDSENDAHNLRVRLVQVKRVIAKAEGRSE